MQVGLLGCNRLVKETPKLSTVAMYIIFLAVHEEVSGFSSFSPTLPSLPLTIAFLLGVR